mmetsp:Transcript_55132/g.172882  ORF Transcript_55132/g.172882 Transcript_55132/m.172882 type:complete len:89 (-) Transcript_55132:72-338(-)
MAMACDKDGCPGPERRPRYRALAFGMQNFLMSVSSSNESTGHPLPSRVLSLRLQFLGLDFVALQPRPVRVCNDHVCLLRNASRHPWCS